MKNCGKEWSELEQNRQRRWNGSKGFEYISEMNNGWITSHTFLGGSVSKTVLVGNCLTDAGACN